MKLFKFIIGLFAISTALSTGTIAQDAMNMTEIGYWDWPESLSEVRGASYDGREYALLGSNTGMSIIDVTDPADLTEIQWFVGPSSIWRDPFYYNGHAYCVTEGGGGMLIVDMTTLPATPLNFTYYTGDTFPFSSAHNMFIDENGVAFLFGTSSVQGAIMLDLTQDPMNPVELGIWNDYYTHDGFVRGDTLWAACLTDGMRVIDVSSPSNPIELGTWPTVGNFAHNVWVSDDGNYAFTTDEIGSGYVAAYDVTDLNNVIETDKINEPLTEGVIPHNTHYVDGWLVTSHYKDGITVYDAHDPDNMIMTAYFDSSPLTGNGFDGVWGVWPYLPSGNILVADISSGFWVIGHEYERGSYLEGNVTEVVSTIPLSGVTVDIESAVPTTESDIFGDYASGTGNPGLYDVSFSRIGYLPLTVEDVELLTGQTITLDVELVPDTPFAFVGQVVDAISGLPITGSDVNLSNPFFELTATTDGNGIVGGVGFYAGEYTITAGSWGYEIFCEEMDITSNTDTLVIELSVGYEDNFELDLGWTQGGSASTGHWELGLPEGTEFDGDQANPDEDGDDCGFSAYITGNGGGFAGDDDVDDGFTRLTSPVMDLSSMEHPFIGFDYWFFNAGGNGGLNDDFSVSIDNGDSTVVMATYEQSSSSWHEVSFLLELFIVPTSNMTLIVEAADNDPGHLVEGGFDNFKAWDVPNLAVNETPVLDFQVYPNPNGSEYFTLDLNSISALYTLTIRDVAGRIISSPTQLHIGKNVISTPEESGLYLLEVFSNGEKMVKRLIVQP
ncbi:MAG: choice-of-anchor B domain-containing protein [Granulosicoccus sp.]|jgi:choice-of-anchor B domain-containing protein